MIYPEGGKYHSTPLGSFDLNLPTISLLSRPLLSNYFFNLA